MIFVNVTAGFCRADSHRELYVNDIRQCYCWFLSCRQSPRAVTAGFCLADGQRTGSVEHLAERAVHQLISITESAGFCRANIQREPYMTFVSISISAGFCRADSQRELYMT